MLVRKMTTLNVYYVPGYLGSWFIVRIMDTIIATCNYVRGYLWSWFIVRIMNHIIATCNYVRGYLW